MGVWLSILLSIAFIGLHAWQVTEERQLANHDGDRAALAREQHLSQLDGLAAAARELGTLATITHIARHSSRSGRAPACRGRAAAERAASAAAPSWQSSGISSGDPFDRISLPIEEVVAPHRNFGVAIDVALSAGDAGEPASGRNPAILYGLGNLLENAVDFATNGSRSRPPGATRTSPSPSSTTGRGLLRRCGRSASPMSPAAGASERTSRTTPAEAGQRARARLLYRQDAAGTLGRQARLREPQVPDRGAVIRVQWGRGISNAGWCSRSDPHFRR